MIPKISLGMVKQCMSYLTVAWFAGNDLPPDRIDEYDEYIEDMKRYAKKNCDLVYLKLAFQSLLTSGKNNSSVIEELSGDCWDFEVGELLSIICYAYSVIWFDGKKPVHIPEPKIEFINMGCTSAELDEWKLNKDKLNPGFSESSVEYY